MIIDIKGKVHRLLRKPRGKLFVTKVVVEEHVDGDRPKYEVVEFFGRDETRCAGLKEGDSVTIRIETANGREWKDDWFDSKVGLLVTTEGKPAVGPGGSDNVHDSELPF